ncbi:hypothetical protein Y032_0424g1215 [Ancylostoma ceylanicum]|uniref:Uncharacterized protein n=1 Tax=Ancylostoma ceylanicum TaxID=53326 RepID=A0A016X139_9BILA|nr:hypothetical protein Y032_0424g1215 [Ancylostoma ceylanicum]
MNCLYILLAFLVLFAQGSDVEFDQESEHGHGHGGLFPPSIDFHTFKRMQHLKNNLDISQIQLLTARSIRLAIQICGICIGALPQVWYIMQSRTAPPLDCGTVEYDIFIEECQVGGTGKRSLTKIYKAFEEPSLSSLRCVALLRLC